MQTATESAHASTSTPTGLMGLACRIIAGLERMPYDVIALAARLGVAGVFWRSGQTKVDGFEVTGNAIFLFQEEYKVPLLPPELAAHMAAYAEHLFPVMLVLGLGSRLGAAGLLGMTIVIQVFVYPNSWPDHLMWAAVLLPVLCWGPGKIALDHLIARKMLPRA